MRYFLDTEYNGWGGALLSLALVPEHGEELYLTLDWDGALEAWVERNVIPYLDTVPDSLVKRRQSEPASSDGTRLRLPLLDPLLPLAPPRPFTAKGTNSRLD